MKTWNVGDKAKTVDGKCTVMALNDCVTAIQYVENGRIEIVGFDELFSPADEQAIKEMTKLYQDGMGPDEFCEMLYLAGYRKKDIDNPANWTIGDWVECVENEASYITVGEIYQIKDIGSDIKVKDDDGDWTGYHSESFKFHKAGELK